MSTLKPNSPAPPPTAMGLELTLLARFPATMLDRACELGMDRGALERATGLVESDLSDPDARVPKVKMLALWREILDHVQDPLFGLKIGASVRTRDVGLVGYVMAASATLGHALECLARYGRILADDVQCVLKPGIGTVDFDVEAGVDLIALEEPVVTRLAAVIAAAREITGQNVCPVEVRLPRSRPADVGPYHDFFQSKVRFDAGETALTFKKADMHLPVPDADEGLSRYLEDYAQGLVDALPARGSLVSQIWRILMVRLPAGDPGIDAVAATLGLNARTVQRRLKDEGTNYSELRDSFRRTTAQKLLSNPRIPIKEIAFLLGYQDLGAFYRAFKRWEDCSPMDYRIARTSH